MKPGRVSLVLVHTDALSDSETVPLYFQRELHGSVLLKISIYVITLQKETEAGVEVERLKHFGPFMLGTDASFKPNRWFGVEVNYMK